MVVSEELENVAAVEPEVNTPEDKSQDTPAEAKNAEIMVPKGRFDEVNEERKALQAEVEAFKKAQKEAEKASLAEQGKYQELAAQYQEEAQQYKNQIENMRIEGLKRDVANKAGYPQLWSRLSGTDEASIEADMAQLASSLPPAVAPNVSGGAGTRERGGAQPAGMSESEKDYISSRLGVPKQFIP